MKIMVDRGDGGRQLWLCQLTRRAICEGLLHEFSVHLSWQGSECSIEHAVVNEQVLESVH